MRLSAVLVAVVTASATFGLSNSANCQTPSPETAPAGLAPSSAESPNGSDSQSVAQPLKESTSSSIAPVPAEVQAIATMGANLHQLGATAHSKLNSPSALNDAALTADPLGSTPETPSATVPELPEKPINALQTSEVSERSDITGRSTPVTPSLQPLSQSVTPADTAQAPPPPPTPNPTTQPTPPALQTPGSEIPTLQENPPGLPPRRPPATPPSSESEPQVLVAEVLVSGVEGELRDEVYRAIGTQPGRTTTRSQLQQDINAIFATGYFRNVRATPEDTPLGVRVTFFVQANPVLRSVQVTGQRVLPQSVLEGAFSDQYGKILNLRRFEEGVKKVNQWYQDNGYVLGQITDAPQVSDDGTVTLVVAEGVIEEIEVRFLNKEGESTDAKGQPIRGNTRQFIITREVEQKSGDVFNRTKAERDLRRVFNLGIFEDVRLSLEPGATDPRKARVIVNVIEKNTGSLAAGAGVSSASGLFGTVSYQQQNLGGNNQRLGAELQIGERSVLFDVNFTDPWIAGDPYRTSYTVNGFRRRSISVIFDGGDREVRLPNGDRPRVVRTGGGISFTRPLSKNPFVEADWTASLGFQYQRVAIRDRDGDRVSRDEFGNLLSFSRSGSDDLFTIQAGLVSDRRDDPLKPTRGSLVRFGMEQSLPIGSGSILFNRLRGSYSYYIPVQYTRFAPGAQTLAFNVQAGTVLGDLPPYEAFALGGSNSVRGYDEGDVGAGRSFIQATAEYRFPIISFIGGALFVDVATDLGTGSSVPGNPAGVRRKPGSGFGYGFGVRIQSPLGPIRIDYGMNDQGDNRIHFGIGERF